MSYLHVADDAPEGGGTLSPGLQQLHGGVKVPDVVGVHPQEGGVLQEGFTQTGTLAPSDGTDVKAPSQQEVTPPQREKPSKKTNGAKISYGFRKINK